MKTNVITESTGITRKNTAILLAGFLTPVILLGSLTVSMMNSGSSEVSDRTAQKYAFEKVYLTDELSGMPTVSKYSNDENEEEIKITLNKDCIRFRDALLPNIGRF